MQTTNVNLKSSNDDSTWQFLSECSLSEVIPDDGLEAALSEGRLFETLRELGLPPVYLEKIKRTLAETARKARSQFTPGRPNLPISICLFCQTKTIFGLNHAKDRMKAGWGYFLILMGRDFPVSPDAINRCLIEMYLYKEGE